MMISRHGRATVYDVARSPCRPMLGQAKQFLPLASVVSLQSRHSVAGATCRLRSDKQTGSNCTCLVSFLQKLHVYQATGRSSGSLQGKRLQDTFQNPFVEYEGCTSRMSNTKTEELVSLTSGIRAQIPAGLDPKHEQAESERESLPDRTDQLNAVRWRRKERPMELRRSRWILGAVLYNPSP